MKIAQCANCNKGLQDARVLQLDLSKSLWYSIKATKYERGGRQGKFAKGKDGLSARPDTEQIDDSLASLSAGGGKHSGFQETHRRFLFFIEEGLK